MSGASRSPVFGANGMVASSQNAATAAGIDILRRGGSAVDAAIATNAALSVIEPHMCGMGGDLFALIWDPGKNALVGLNASGRSPRALSFEELHDSSENGYVPGRGPLSVTTPGAVDGWCELHENYGRLSLREVLQPAAELAEGGVSIGINTSAAWAEAVKHLDQDSQLENLLQPFLDTYTQNGRSPEPGEVFRNPALANTLRVLGEQGRTAFYEGQIAAKLLDYLRAAGCYLDDGDMAANCAHWVEPISTRYRDVDIFELPPNGQGMCVLQMLNILEHFPLAEYGRNDARYWHAFLEAKKLAFEDRAKYYADTETYQAPIEWLNDKAYARSRYDLIDPGRAGREFTAGRFAEPGSDTTYLSTADSDGLMVSMIQSIFSPFGAGLVPPELGFALQSRGAGFTLEQGHANCYAPAKRPFHTIIPAFACREGEPWLGFGVMGADMQPQGQVQVLCNMIDFGMDPQRAGDAFRLRHDGGRQPNGRHMDGIGEAQFEAGFDPEIVAELQKRGHNMLMQKTGIAGFMGGYQGIVRDRERGAYIGATETRLDGMALGI